MVIKFTMENVLVNVQMLLIKFLIIATTVLNFVFNVLMEIYAMFVKMDIIYFMILKV